jgi:cephalosporin hydroxylase
MLTFKEFLAEGSARGAYTRRGEYAKSRDAHLQDAERSEKVRGIKQSPKTDARKYSRTHTTAYNKGSSEYEADKKRAASLQKPKKKVAVKTPVRPDQASDRIKDILNHPMYKKMTGNS